MAFKKERLEKIIARETSQILFSEVKDQRLKLVTITNVNLSGDLSIATIFFTVYGDEEVRIETAKALEEAKGFIRLNLGHRIEVKKVPELRFKYDESFEQGNRIEDILKGLNDK